MVEKKIIDLQRQKFSFYNDLDREIEIYVDIFILDGVSGEKYANILSLVLFL